MSAPAKNALQLARLLFRLSVADGGVSPERVTAVLAYVEKHQPPDLAPVLRSYRRLIAAELARSRAVVEHAGAVSEPLMQEIASALAKRYRRPVTAVSQPNAALLAGLRVRLGDDVYEASAAGQLAALAAAG